MKDIVVIKIPGYPKQEELDKIKSGIEDIFEGTNQKPLILYGDTEVYMMKEDNIIDFLPEDLKEFIREQKLKRLGL